MELKDYEVDISGLDKAELLAALYNNSAPLGMGFLQAVPGGMSIEVAKTLVEQEVGDDHTQMFGKDSAIGRGRPSLYFDYLKGRPLKVDLTGDKMRTALYDRDNGHRKTARQIVEELRAKAEQQA
jgi:hypothetical protein